MQLHLGGEQIKLVGKYTWLLFDADGTLFDYDRAEAAALERTLQQSGASFEGRYVQAYRQINDRIWRQFELGQITQERLRIKRFQLLCEAIDLNHDPAILSRQYLKNLAQEAELIEGAEEIVKSLQGRVGLALITNGLSEVQRPRFAKSAVSGCFSALVISEEVGVAKPDGRIFDIAFREMGHPRKEQVLMVGDSLTSDMKGGRDYGIDTCWFNPRKKPRDPEVEVRYEIQRLGELMDIVEAGTGNRFENS